MADDTIEKPWLEHYPEGIPAEIDVNRYGSLIEMVDEAIERYPDLYAFTNFGHHLTYAEVGVLSGHFASYLQQVVGLARGARVAIMMPNILKYGVAVFGAMRAGYPVVPINPLYSSRELEHQLNDSGAEVLLILENFAHKLEPILDRTPVRHVILSRLGDLFSFPRSAMVNFLLKRVKKAVPDYSLPDAVWMKEVLEKGATKALDNVSLTHDDIALLQYTGGTTGVAKGAVLTHGNMVANILQTTAWIKPITREGEEVVITALPLYHIFAMTANLLTYFMYGAENVLITNPRDFRRFVKVLRKIPFTVFTGVNSLFNAMLNTPGFEQVDFSHFRGCLSGGMAAQARVAERWHQVTGVPLLEAYGLSETAPAVLMNPMTNTAYNGSVGLPISSTLVTIRDEQGCILPPGEVGEVCIKGPQVMREYWNRPRETEGVFLPDRWFRSGDIGYMDERGFFYLCDRKKDMINVSGFNVFPNEVEDVVAQLDGVVEVAVVGVPDERSSETVRLYVVVQDETLTEERIMAYCRDQLAAYKVPKQIVFMDELPKSTVGKVLRRALREKA